MRILGKGFGRRQPVDETVAADGDWSRRVRGVAVLQTADEQQATRRSMEAELDTQRERRAQGSPPDISATR